ncbi:Putative pterin-4-alpha-carbinolamine dehydratase [Gemmata obscuriglobus]|uniref:Putative pterin-4-alpha-carbinolamine dehydratase n=2 Tax=Gemmata TaxID=113 RepID=A0A2Z3HC61_9BACT|nr:MULTISPECIES: 4a-hydroxytetrahydrobiopterin dehydratase [Gemmata]AWM41992.1 4a-hydroxytetrahydrobiopterin dehydratase [Gemmata obscuriglobus]MDY3556876.1 4a-hydroxytetrahydrobiopterin dehydratase [Gemmata algarum]MDY3563481.1 4a-hydroxytetrahydrobiopterin dehydratase [Gemmata algarum]QEG32021.1 Putative pterin-4-alpha-carbinolamine dehydratase [Gemmata obscuriglobus]VTS11371.1 pterin-4-alpha-carbinolamine dehydratase : 4a-hydroxytetrahydrobiopterin dehydratase OS=Planctomyces limnophilus (s
MSVSAAELTAKKCTACEGGTPPLAADQVAAHLAAVPGWALSDDGKLIRRKYKFTDFASAMAFLNRVADLAEAEDHHPDLHLTGYRHAAVELSTHAIGGLSANDFIVAAKIDALG